MPISRSICLTKNYCSKECSIADKSVHNVCCRNLLGVEKRKQKKDGRVRAENSNKNFEEWQKRGKVDNPGPEFSAVLNEVVSKVKKVKVNSDKKEKGGKNLKASEVD